MRLRTQGLLLAAGVLAACSVQGVDKEPERPVDPVDLIVADLRADSNRDGKVSFDDESDADKTTWDAHKGAIFLANIDDDRERCPKEGDDAKIAACNDAADEIVNGADDALDLARLKTRPWAEAPEGTSALVTIETEAAVERVRLFKRTGEGDTDFSPLVAEEPLTVDEVRAGVELAIEAKDIVRDPAVWDGYVHIKLTVTTPLASKSDTVRMRVSPVMTFHHLSPAETAWASNTRTAGNRDMRKDLTEACAEAGLPAPKLIDDYDPWTEDFFETGYMSMPDATGGQHVIRVTYRSANVYEPSDKKNPLRPAGQVVFTSFRGKDSAGIQQYDVKHDLDMDSLNSFGNLETVPPYTLGDRSYPLGRVLRGSTATFFPDKSFTKMMDAQAIQPPIHIDTSWLLVGHVDETLSFIKADNPRGWVLLANDARLAKKMLEDLVAAGHGDATMFVGKNWEDFKGGTRPAEISVSDVLANTTVMQASAEAAVEVDAQLAILKKEIGLEDKDIVRIPFLHTVGGGGSMAYQPGTVNGIYLSDKVFGAPDPHGPLIGGKDPFKEAMVSALAPYGVKVHWIEDWDGYHVGIGEVHCGTNTTRKIPDAKWWESGR